MGLTSCKQVGGYARFGVLTKDRKLAYGPWGMATIRSFWGHFRKILLDSTEFPIGIGTFTIEIDEFTRRVILFLSNIKWNGG